MTTPVTGPVLVLLDHAADGGLRQPVLELLTAARALGTVHGAWTADADGSDPDARTLELLGTYGVETVHRLDVGDADVRLTPVLAQGLTALVQSAGASVLLLTSSFENKEVAARVGLATGAGVVVDASAVEVADDRVVAAKTVFAGTWNTRCAVRTPLAVIALKAGSVQAEPAAERVTATVVAQAVTVDDGARRVRVTEHTERAASTRPDLAAAQVVVVGGRGTNGDFALLEELADVLGGAVGATRVATDEGWIGHDAQIGQTGVTVAPQLYIGAGVSGAVHHRGGMQSAGTIVAINNDPEAPIFEIADFGIVGDLFTVLPQATAELRRLKG
ncbi:electron transfer flavoprotein subunit alpha/FixB family protein [Cellulomonas sp. WB94]|uniref:electron transfer flavoprotein subunit alpha/FixB family protein n=1 Tax=Cellulomonas sp. WB94 TaxID=2173174 RepID=UPI000D5656D1|nr:electron transfer flavoprotein subunit alpha/FixB family protein [Cellulomonas sp. WB94]PVU83681.1 electron transfer flavoprotein subunit alpha/FixB family protein [Cellulomonas sp. WB94]